jgi:hypothetical protein
MELIWEEDPPFAGCDVPDGGRKSMIRRFASTLDLFLDAKDLNICQRAFDAILVEMNVTRDTFEAERAAAIIINLYRQGIHDEAQIV